MAKWPTVDHGPCRYAVLQHSGVEEPHFDFLFERNADGPLVTFRLREWPLTENQPVTRLRDHRRMYLTYEGAIPGDRGRVDRVAEGTVHVIETSGWLLQHANGEFFALFEPYGEPYADDQPDWRVTLPE